MITLIWLLLYITYYWKQNKTSDGQKNIAFTIYHALEININIRLYNIMNAAL